MTNEKVDEINIPAVITEITIDKPLQKETKEIFGKVVVITNGYYSYVNAWSFKNDYIYKRKKIAFYFRCNITSNAH
ncbi:MAG: hypothetical protein JO072_09040 [Parafilimonas sp.]|nr:hypothetical protein [Parafilimonas sp.]